MSAMPPPSLGYATPDEQYTQRQLHNSDPKWVRTLTNAVNLMLIGIIVGFVNGIVAKAVGSAALMMVMALAMAVLYFAAMWMLTTPEPGNVQPPDESGPRNMLRIFAIINLVASLVQAFFPTAAGNAAVKAGGFQGLAVLGGVMMLIGVASYWFFYVYLNRLARRIPNLAMAKNSLIIAWGLTVSLALVILGPLLAVLLKSLSPLTLSLLGGLGAIVFGIWALVLLIQFRGAFDTAATQAASGGAGPVGGFPVGGPPPRM
jgi:hypothetical protein